MTLTQKEPKSIKIGTTNIKKVMMRPGGVGTQVRPKIPPYLCFTAEAASSSVVLSKSGSPADVSLEISSDGETWSDYTIGNTINLSNVGDKVYMRNKSKTPVTLSSSNNNNYRFTMTGTIAGSGNINYLLCKNGTNDLFDYCYIYLFFNCTSLTTAPKLPSTATKQYCYRSMFSGCSNLTTVNKLPATYLLPSCYQGMYFNCSKIKLSTSQTSDYTQAYRIPTEGTATVVGGVNSNMFRYTGGSFAGTPTIETTYYVHKDNTIV